MIFIFIQLLRCGFSPDEDFVASIVGPDLQRPYGSFYPQVNGPYNADFCAIKNGKTSCYNSYGLPISPVSGMDEIRALNEGIAVDPDGIGNRIITRYDRYGNEYPIEVDPFGNVISTGLIGNSRMAGIGSPNMYYTRDRFGNRFLAKDGFGNTYIRGFSSKGAYVPFNYLSIDRNGNKYIPINGFTGPLVNGDMRPHFAMKNANLHAANALVSGFSGYGFNNHVFWPPGTQHRPHLSMKHKWGQSMLVKKNPARIAKYTSSSVIKNDLLLAENKKLRAQLENMGLDQALKQSNSQNFATNRRNNPSLEELTASLKRSKLDKILFDIEEPYKGLKGFKHIGPVDFSRVLELSQKAGNAYNGELQNDEIDYSKIISPEAPACPKSQNAPVESIPTNRPIREPIEPYKQLQCPFKN